MNVSLVLTHDCNLGCPYCYAGRKFRKVMPREVAEKAIEYTLYDGAERVQVSFFGGEPFLAFGRMREVVELARAALEGRVERLKFVVTTNGTALNEERLDFLREQDFFVGLSIDGVEPAHDANRPFVNGKGSFHVVRRGLRQLLASGVDFETVSVVDPANVAYLGQTVRFLIDEGVRRISLNPNFDADWSDDDLARWEQGYEEAGRAYVECYRRGHLVRINIVDDKVLTHLKGGYKLWDRCEFGAGSIAVAPSGNIYPCERLVGEDQDDTFCIGNVMDGFSGRRRCLIESCGNHNPECAQCALFDRCMSWCACANLADTGHYDIPGGLLCWHEQMAIRVADRVAAELFITQNPLFLQHYYLR